MGVAYLLFEAITRILDDILGNLALDEPSLLFLAIAVLSAANAVILWFSLRNDGRLARMRTAGTRIEQLSRVVFWIGFFYLVLRLPVTAFTAFPAWLGHTLLMMVMYSLAFAPLWIGLVIVAWKLTRIACAQDGDRRRKLLAAIALAASSGWGLIGELHLLLEPTLLKTVVLGAR